METIHIDWDGPYHIDDLNNLNNQKIDYGIYQIYGVHPVYGTNILLYIGKAEEQTFGIRIRQEHWDDKYYTGDHKRVEIYVGRFAGSTTPQNEKWADLINLSERLLILANSPAYNSKCIDSPSSSLDDSKLQNIHILNWGAFRNILPEVSGSRWTSKLDKIPYKIYEYNENSE